MESDDEINKWKSKQSVLSINEKHWYGATPMTAMTHIAIQAPLDGKVVDWMEHVTDKEHLLELRKAERRVRGSGSVMEELRCCLSVLRSNSDTAVARFLGS